MRLFSSMLHIGLHFVIPLIIARLFYNGPLPNKAPLFGSRFEKHLSHWFKAWLILSLTMLVDLDHLLAVPIYDPLRCSINFHPLHTYWAIAIYCLLFLFKKTRLIALGLIIHMLLDWQDCYFKI